MKEFIVALLLAYIAFLLPIRDYILVSEVLICGNYVLYSYVKRNKKRKPLWVLIFASFIGIVSTRLFDLYFYSGVSLCDKLAKGICYYQLVLLSKNISLILGIDLTKLINIKTKNKNEND